MSIDFGLDLNASREILHLHTAHDMIRVPDTLKDKAFNKAPNKFPARTQARGKVGVESTQLEFSLGNLIMLCLINLTAIPTPGQWLQRLLLRRRQHSSDYDEVKTFLTWQISVQLKRNPLGLKIVKRRLLRWPHLYFSA